MSPIFSFSYHEPNTFHPSVPYLSCGRPSIAAPSEGECWRLVRWKVTTVLVSMLTMRLKVLLVLGAVLSYFTDVSRCCSDVQWNVTAALMNRAHIMSGLGTAAAYEFIGPL